MSKPTPRAAPAPLDDVTRQAHLLEGLPTISIVSARLGEVLHSRRASVGQVAELISADQSLSAKLLRLVNSSYFGIPGGVPTVAAAIPFVGFNTIYQLVLSVSVLDTLKTPEGGAFDPRPLWRHSLAVAAAARVIAEDLRHPDPGALFTAGLLHDMGKIALAKLDPDRFLRVLQIAEQDGVPMHVAEAQVGLPPHDRMGAELARRWRLPASLIVPIEGHHSMHEPEARGRLAPGPRLGAEIVAVADLIGHDATASAGQPIRPVDESPETRAFLDAIGLGDAHRDSLHHRVMAQLERSKPFLDLLE